MTTDGTQQQPDTPPEPVESKPGLRQKIGRVILRPLLGKDHPPSRRRKIGRGFRNLVKEPGLGVNVRGTGSGVALIAQAVAAGYFLFTLPLLAQPAGVAFLAGVAVIGLYGIGYGLPRLWKNLENVCEKNFRRFNPLRWIRLRTERVLKAISEKPLMQKLGSRIDRLKNRIAQSPHFKKFMKSRTAAFLGRKLTPRQQDTFLAVLTAQVSLAAFTLGSVGLGFYLAAGGRLLSPGVASVAIAAGTNAFDLTRSICVLLKTSRAKRKANKAAAKEAAPVSAPEPAVTAAAPLPDATAPAFNAKAGAKAATADAGADKTQTRPVSAAPTARTSPARVNQRRAG